MTKADLQSIIDRLNAKISAMEKDMTEVEEKERAILAEVIKLEKREIALDSKTKDR